MFVRQRGQHEQRHKLQSSYRCGILLMKPKAQGRMWWEMRLEVSRGQVKQSFHPGSAIGALP